mmetsp:Transcript_18939/g.39521  ORF Transcript_18939/g.39521 Transcript_18939/m.39521 type:complete len:213 (-) Transcript_18939:97-735(-)
MEEKFVPKIGDWCHARPDIIVLSVGVNNLLEMQRESNFEKDLTSLLRAWNATQKKSVLGAYIEPTTNHWLDQWQALSSGTLSPDAATVLTHEQILSLDFRPKPGAGLEIDCSGTTEDCTGDGGVDGFGAAGVPQGWANYVGAYSLNSEDEPPGAGIRRTAFPFPARDPTTGIAPEERADEQVDPAQAGAFLPSSSIPLTLLMALLISLAMMP